MNANHTAIRVTKQAAWHPQGKLAELEGGTSSWQMAGRPMPMQTLLLPQEEKLQGESLGSKGKVGEMAAPRS